MNELLTFLSQARLENKTFCVIRLREKCINQYFLFCGYPVCIIQGPVRKAEPLLYFEGEFQKGNWLRRYERTFRASWEDLWFRRKYSKQLSPPRLEEQREVEIFKSRSLDEGCFGTAEG